jgi:uncharacterized membrane protein YdjX (TVP38/TMEM64 family)
MMMVQGAMHDSCVRRPTQDIAGSLVRRSVTSISLRSYVLALVGMVPAVAAYTFLGASAGELSGVASSSSSSKAGALHIVIYVVGAVTLLAAVALISWYARRELKRAGVDSNGT